MAWIDNEVETKLAGETARVKMDWGYSIILKLRVSSSRTSFGKIWKMFNEKRNLNGNLKTSIAIRFILIDSKYLHQMKADKSAIEAAA